MALIEFTIAMPMMLLLFATTIEGGRLMWSYQSVNAGVRDATRYLARVAPTDICDAGGSVSGYTSDLETIVRKSASGNAIFPSGITVNSVTASLTCVTGSFRVSPAPVVRVTASLTVTFPFSGLFTFSGQSQGTLTKTVSDQTRVYGT